jgi:hypothetical protein
MRTMGAFLAAEAIKLRRSAPVRLAIAAPALLCFLVFLTFLPRSHFEAANPTRLWRDLLRDGWVFWLGLFTPALIALQSVCLINVEHSGRHWKQIFVLPVSRWKFFAGKMLVCALLLAASFLLFVFGSVAAVLAFSTARGLHLASAIPFLEIASSALRAWAASWLLIVIHIWISARYPGFAVPAATAFTAILVGFLLVAWNPNLFGWWYPWTLPINVRPEGFYDSHNTLAPALFGSLAGALLAPLASWDLGRRIKDV